jgi:hypothetical protein
LKPLAFFALLFITEGAIGGLATVPLVNDIIASSGYSASEVWAGLATIVLIFYVALFAATGGR